MKSFIVCILILGGVFACRIPVSGASSAISVKVAYIKKTVMVKSITAPGTVHSNGRLVVYSPFTGRLIEPFSLPGYVPAGTVIARIVDPGLYAKIISAEASVKYAKIKFKRVKLLFRDGVAAKKDVERAALSLANAYSALHTLESREREGVLVSHFKGTVHYLLPDGAIVTAGSRVAVLNGRGMPWIRAYITPSQSFKLYDNMQVNIKTKDIRGTGRVISIGGSAGHNGLVPVYISLPKDSPLLPGEWVTLRFTESKTAAFSLPEKAVVMLHGGTFVFTVRHNKALAVRVKVTNLKDGAAYIKGNIKVGEPIIVYPVTRLVSGIPVEITR
jgi:multidrug efflux pump subunit AcrA (membrane-fusion protein)